MAPFSKEMLLQDFGQGIETLGNALNCLIGDQLRAFTDIPEGSKEEPALALARTLPGGELLSDAYDFAYDGRLRHGVFKDESYEMDVLLNRFQGLRETVSEEGGGDFNLCVRTMKMARHRMLLHGDTMAFTSRGPLWNNIALLELAYLAGVDDKTLRNMTSPKHPARLQTIKIDKRTFVSLNVAIPWLLARGFKQSVLEDYRADRAFNEDGFLSVADLAEYTRERRTALGLSADDVAARMGNGIGAEAIRQLEDGTPPRDEAFLISLGTALEVRDVPSFAKSASALSEVWYDKPPVQ